MYEVGNKVSIKTSWDIMNAKVLTGEIIAIKENNILIIHSTEKNEDKPYLAAKYYTEWNVADVLDENGNTYRVHKAELTVPSQIHLRECLKNDVIDDFEDESNNLKLKSSKIPDSAIHYSPYEENKNELNKYRGSTEDYQS